MVPAPGIIIVVLKTPLTANVSGVFLCDDIFV